MQKVKRVINSINSSIINEIEREFISKEQEVKDIILNEYDGLSGTVTSSENKTNPSIFKDVFEEKLNNFVFVKRVSDTNIRFVTPDLINFDFSGIDIIKQILEGTSGVYVEISHEDLVKITGKTTINDVPIESGLPKRKRVYLIKYLDWVRKKEKSILKKTLLRFPFSNTPALDGVVFGTAEEYVDDNIDRWVNDAIKRSTTVISQRHKRV